MSDILVFTNRSLCRGDFLTRIGRLAKARPKAIVLREKDILEEEYKTLAKAVLDICREHGTLCVLHSFPAAAEELNAKALHVPLHLLRALSVEERGSFKVLGASCHSAGDAVEAEKLGCTYITAGHIFDTSCKKGLPGRGLAFLRKVCESVSIPVYAIGGIDFKNIAEVRKAGAKGACVMSGAMICEDIPAYFAAFKGN